MFLSALGKAIVIGTLSLAATPAIAMEPAPLDSAILSQVTAMGMDEVVPLAWLLEPDRPADTGQGVVRTILQPGRTSLSFDRQDSRGALSRIVQTATIDLPRTAGSQALVGVVMQSGGYDVAGGGQTATNLAVAGTLFAFFRP